MATEALETIEETDEPTEVNLGGRPTAYRAQFAKTAYRLALLGCTDADLCATFDVSQATISTWKITHPRFLEALRKGKTEADANVAHKLYKRATGYSHPETKVMVIDGEVERIDVTKHYAPDAGAAKLWLTNRRPDLWRDRANVDITSNGQSISQLAAAAWAFGESLRVQTIEAPDAQKLLSDPTEPA